MSKTTQELQISLYLLLGYFVFLFCIHLNFVFHHREVIYLMEITVQELREKRLGRIKEVRHREKQVVIQDSPFSKQYVVQLSHSYYDINIPFRTANNELHYTIWGNLEKLRDTRHITSFVTRDNFENLFTAKDIIATLTEKMNIYKNEQMKQFEMLFNTMVSTQTGLEKLKDRVGAAFRAMPGGFVDYQDLFEIAHGVSRDEIDDTVIQTLLTEHREEKAKSRAKKEVKQLTKALNVDSNKKEKINETKEGE